MNRRGFLGRLMSAAVMPWAKRLAPLALMEAAPAAVPQMASYYTYLLNDDDMVSVKNVNFNDITIGQWANYTPISWLPRPMAFIDMDRRIENQQALVRKVSRRRRG